MGSQGHCHNPPVHMKTCPEPCVTAPLTAVGASPRPYLWVCPSQGCAGDGLWSARLELCCSVWFGKWSSPPQSLVQQPLIHLRVEHPKSDQAHKPGPVFSPLLPTVWLILGVSWGQGPVSVVCSPPWVTGPSQEPAGTALLAYAPGDAERSILHWDPLPPPKGKAFPPVTRSFTFEDKCSPECLSLLWSCVSPVHPALGLRLLPASTSPSCWQLCRHAA